MTLSRFACSDWFLSLSGYGCYAFGGAKDRHSLPVGLNGSADYAGTEYFLLGEFISTIGCRPVYRAIRAAVQAAPFALTL